MYANPSRRGGFTLVELLVAVSIIIVLAAIAAVVANSGIIGNVRTSSGSDRVAGWLMQAREKAKRDNAPRGIRFIADGNGYIREAQLIEVPEPYLMPAGNRLMIQHSPSTRRAFVVGPNAADVIANVGVNDTLSIRTTNTIHRLIGPPTVVPGGITINAVNYPAVEIPVVIPALLPDLGAAALAADPAPGTYQPTYSTEKFGFIRQARPTFGEPPLLVPETVAICVNLFNPDGTGLPAAGPTLSLIPAAGGNFDVLFAPNGEVMNANGLGRVVLWTVNPEAVATLPNAGGVRATGDLRSTYEAAGEMRHVVVYTKTGAVAVQPIYTPVDEQPNIVTPHDPYANTKDGLGSGL